MSRTCNECGGRVTLVVPQDAEGDAESYWCTAHGANKINSRPLEGIVMGKLTKARCEEIMLQCRKLATHGPWVDQMDKVMTKEERKEVMEYWVSVLPGHTSFYDAFMIFKRGRVNYVEITGDHVGKALFPAFGRQWSVTGFIGRIMPQDVGKRVYLVEDILQVENDEQRAERLKVQDFKQFKGGD